MSRDGEILEGNITLAEFMDDDGEFERVKGKAGVIMSLSYHDDYLWLMPVVEKIDSLGYDVVINRISCKVLKFGGDKNPIASWVCGDLSKKKEIIFDTCVEFAKWYKTTNNS